MDAPLLKSKSKKSLFNINLWFVHYLFFSHMDYFCLGENAKTHENNFTKMKCILQNASTTTYYLVFLLDSSTRAYFHYYFMILPSWRKKNFDLWFLFSNFLWGRHRLLQTWRALTVCTTNKNKIFKTTQRLLFSFRTDIPSVCNFFMFSERKVNFLPTSTASSVQVDC